jgi:hypothetical protein
MAALVPVRRERDLVRWITCLLLVVLPGSPVRRIDSFLLYPPAVLGVISH